MSKAEEYLERVVIATTAAGNGPIATALADRCGIASDDVQAIIAKIAPARVALTHMDEANGKMSRASATLKDSLAGITSDITSLRHTLSDNYDRNNPIYKDLGLQGDTPRPQEELLGFAEIVFTNGQNLDQTTHALLVKRKWDTARFTTALAQVAAARAANIEQEAAKGQSLAATSAFYDAADELDELFRPFAKNARSNLADVPGALKEMRLDNGLPAKPQRPTPADARKKPVAATTPVTA